MKHLEHTSSYQFFIQDESASGDLSSNWSPEAIARKLAQAPNSGIIGIGTARNTSVPVVVEILASQPDNINLAEWDQVNECSLYTATGRLVVAGVSDFFPEAPRLTVSPGWYRVRICYGGLNALSNDGLDGNDRYIVTVWPSPNAEIRIVK